MADKPAKASGSRRVKSPETFRERALKAAQPETESRRSRLNLTVIWKPFRRAYQGLAGVKLLRPLHRPLRIIGKILLPSYLRNSWRELKLVKWPSWKESRQLTFAVLVFAVIFGAAIALVDLGLDKLFKQILLK